MIGLRPKLEVALLFHRALPGRIRRYLNLRGIPDDLIRRHLLGWNGERITIPVFDREGELAFFRLAKDPEDTRPGPKILTPAGARAELYGWERVTEGARRLIICEGEFDRLVLEARGFPAVTSTGGAGVFRPEWARALNGIPELHIVFDRDEAGRTGALKVGRLLPRARIVELPEEVGPGGDVTDFFVRLGKGPEDFLRLLEAAGPAPRGVPEGPGKRKPRPAPSWRHEDVEALKARVPIERVVERHVTLRPVGRTLVGRCPFHDDRHPSFFVYPETQTFHCYGCGAHGDVLAFIMRTHGLTFPEALEVLRRVTI